MKTHDVPRVPRGERIEVADVGNGLQRATVHYGFAQDVHIPAALALANAEGLLTFKPMETTYFLGREHIMVDPGPPMSLWRARIFALLSRNATGATTFFHLPPNRVVEMGSQLKI